MDSESTVSRTVVPRWRHLSRTPSRELESSIKKQRANGNTEFATDHVQLLHQIWSEAPTIENATQIIDAASSEHERMLAVGPAQMVLESQQTMPAVRAVAEHVIQSGKSSELGIFKDVGHEQTIVAQIHVMKKILRDDPRNALAWLEKSMLYTKLGDVRSAEQAIVRSLACASDNRFILRCFSRFMVHKGEYDRAHDALVRSRNAGIDPWIQAAEISVAELAGRDPQTLKQSRRSLADRNFEPFHVSELAAAMGMLEAAHGKRRLSTKLFKRCLIDPTDNALSQVCWMRERGDITLPIDESQLRMPGAAEARFLTSVFSEDWLGAVEAGEEWVRDESFSLRAASNGSFIASSFLSQNERAIRFCDLGLTANPSSSILINNKVVALCRSGQLTEASKLLDRLHTCKPSDSTHVAALATLGLYAFRSGRVDEGRKRYAASVEAAENRLDMDARFRALFHWVYEEVHCGALEAELKDNVCEMLDEMAAKTELNRTTKQLWSLTRKQIEEMEMRCSPSNDVFGVSLMPHIVSRR